MTSTSSIALDGCFSATLIFKLHHKLSIGFESELLPGLSSTRICSAVRKSLTDFDLWHGIPSCMKIGHRRIYMWSFNLSSKKNKITPSMHIGFRRQEIQSRNIRHRHFTPHHLAWRTFHCWTNMFPHISFPFGGEKWAGNCWILYWSENNTALQQLYCSVLLFPGGALCSISMSNILAWGC